VSSSRLPWSLQENPRLDDWLDFSEPGVVRALTAKVELGQGIVTAMTPSQSMNALASRVLGICEELVVSVRSDSLVERTGFELAVPLV